MNTLRDSFSKIYQRFRTHPRIMSFMLIVGHIVKDFSMPVVEASMLFCASASAYRIPQGCRGIFFPPGSDNEESNPKKSKTSKKKKKAPLGPVHKKSPKSVYASAVSSDESLCVSVWKDKTVLYYVTNTLTTAEGTVHRYVKGRKLPDGQRRGPVPCPSLGVVYNTAYQPVDRADQFRAGQYGLSRMFRCSKWIQMVYLGMFDIAMSNSWILYRLKYPKKRKNGHAMFMLSVGWALAYCGLRKPSPEQPDHVITPLLSVTDSKGNRKDQRGSCRICHERSRFGCFTCRVALHPKCAPQYMHDPSSDTACRRSRLIWD